jgi:energy coupling factor transporter S component ThiW
MKRSSTRKLVLTGMMACLAFVLNTFVYFPAMAPFQHFVDVVAAVFLGPWYACAAAFLCGVMRMMSGRTIQAIAGAVFDLASDGSVLNRKERKLLFIG